MAPDVVPPPPRHGPGPHRPGPWRVELADVDASASTAIRTTPIDRPNPGALASIRAGRISISCQRRSKWLRPRTRGVTTMKHPRSRPHLERLEGRIALAGGILAGYDVKQVGYHPPPVTPPAP